MTTSHLIVEYIFLSMVASYCLNFPICLQERGVTELGYAYLRICKAVRLLLGIAVGDMVGAVFLVKVSGHRRAQEGV